MPRPYGQKHKVLAIRPCGHLTHRRHTVNNVCGHSEWTPLWGLRSERATALSPAGRSTGCGSCSSVAGPMSGRGGHLGNTGSPKRNYAAKPHLRRTGRVKAHSDNQWCRVATAARNMGNWRVTDLADSGKGARLHRQAGEVCVPAPQGAALHPPGPFVQPPGRPPDSPAASNHHKPTPRLPNGARKPRVHKRPPRMGRDHGG